MIDPSNLFETTVQETWLEIGFGGGERLYKVCRKNQKIGFIGIEPFQDGTSKIFKNLLIEDPEVRDDFCKRLRICQEPVIHFLKRCAPGTLTRIDILFPDPWPKKRHHKRRLIQTDFVEACTHLLKPGGLLCIASDHQDYVAHIFRVLNEQKFVRYKGGIKDLDPTTWPAWPTEWPLTRYAQKAHNAGTPLAYFIWQRPEV